MESGRAGEGVGGVSYEGVAEDGEDGIVDEDDFLPLLLSPSMSRLPDGALHGSSLLDLWVEDFGAEEGVEVVAMMEALWHGFFVASIFGLQGCAVVPINGLFSTLSLVGGVLLPVSEMVSGQIWDSGGSLVERLFVFSPFLYAEDLLLF